MSEPTPDVPQEGQPAAEPATEPDWKAEARKWEQRAKENSQKLKELTPKAAEYERLEQASKTELERAQEELARWQGEAQKWRTTSVTSRVETIASADFADPTDALAAIDDPSKYLGAGGEIDEAAIKADLAAVLERKPHWRKAAQGSPGPRIPAPNPAQGSGVNGKAATDPAAQFASIIQGQMNRS